MDKVDRIKAARTRAEVQGLVEQERKDFDNMETDDVSEFVSRCRQFREVLFWAHQAMRRLDHE